MDIFIEIKLALGETGKNMSDEEIQKLMALFDQLSGYWLDEREKYIFGSTIKEMLEV